jgi:hypothetical protein
MKTATANARDDGAGAATTSNKGSEPVMLLKRIGSTTYTVAVHFSDKNAERVEDKLLRIIEREVTKDVS